MTGTTNFPTSLDSHTGGNPFGFAEVANLKSTRLNGAISNSATTITVDSTTGFASRGIIVIGSELITYTGTTATTFTGCTRGAGGTSAAAHLSRRSVSSVPVAANHNDLAAAIVAIETVLGAGISTPNGVMRLLSSVVVGAGGVAQVNFTSIPQTYATLLIQFVARSESAAGSADNVAIRLGTGGSIDTGANYQWSQSYTAGAAVTGNDSATAGINTNIFGGQIPISSSPANSFGRGNIWLHQYTNTHHNKHCVSNTAAITASGSGYVNTGNGMWSNTGALSDIRLYLFSGADFEEHSVFKLYGIPG